LIDITPVKNICYYFSCHQPTYFTFLASSKLTARIY